MAMLTETQTLAGVTVNAEELIQKADQTKLSSDDLRSRVGNFSLLDNKYIQNCVSK